jgi:hypothetical protein
MSPLAISLLVFACVAASALVGIFVRRSLPERHLTADSRELVKLGIGLVGTMAGLVLGLLVGSAKGSYDAQKNNLVQLSVRIVMLDRALAHYGPKTKETRKMFRAGVARMLAEIWPDDSAQAAQLDPTATRAEGVYELIQKLAPKTEAERALQAEARIMALELMQFRWLLFEQAGSAISTPFLLVLVLWFSVIFASFNLMAPPNPTITVTVLIYALAIAGAIFLILELDRHFDGMLRIPSTPLRKALAELDR